MVAKSKQSDRSRLSLVEVAHHLVIPDGISGTLWPGVAKRCGLWGDGFDLWQSQLGELMFALRDDGTFAASIGGVVLSIPRQVAKTFLVSRCLLAICSLYPGTSVLWTAHHGATSARTFDAAAAAMLRPKAAKFLADDRSGGIYRGHADEGQQIKFRNSSVMSFGTRSGRKGRGFTEVDHVVFDEAQILSPAALAAITPTLQQSKFPRGSLMFFMGTPPTPEDDGVEFANRRAEALELKPPAAVQGIGGDGLYVECSADDNVGRPGGPGLMDVAQIEKANPSYPLRTSWLALQRTRKQLDDDAWRREALGVWDTAAVAPTWTITSEAQWQALAVDEAPTEGLVAFAVKFSADNRLIAVGAAVKPVEGPVHVECLGVAANPDGVRPLVGWLSARWRTSRIVVDGKAGVGDLKGLLGVAGVPPYKVVEIDAGMAAAAAQGFNRAMADGLVSHAAQPGLDRDVEHAVFRAFKGQSGGYGWAGSGGFGCAALDAVTLAYWAAQTAKPVPKQQGMVVL